MKVTLLHAVSGEPGWTSGGPLADMHGVLGVNDRGCVTLGGDVMVAQEGSRVTPDGKHVIFPGYAPIRIGTAMSGGGGYVGSRDSLTDSHMDQHLIDALDRCLGDDPSATAVQFWLAQG